MIGERVFWFQVQINLPYDYGYTIFRGKCLEESLFKDGYLCEPQGGKSRWVPKNDVKWDIKELRQAVLDRIEWLRGEYNKRADELREIVERDNWE